MQTVFLLSTLLALRGAAALRLSQDPAVVGAAAHADEVPPGALERKQRQVMTNFQDVQYFAYLTIGGQPLTGLLDTGSFDLVVFDQACSACGRAGKYSSKQSLSYKAGMLKQNLNYGSGSVEVYESTDQVAIGPYGEVNLTFWDGMDAMMPVLANAAFNAIVGVGPPETVASDAWSVVEDSVVAIRDHLEYTRFPDSGMIQELGGATDLAMVLGTQPTLVKADDVAHFSICLGQKPGSAGYFIWNDTSYLDTPSLFTFIKVLGRHTWTINMTSLQLDRRGHRSNVVACKTGCGAIIDSGTSLILMPYPAISVLREALRKMPVDCDNIHSLPKLTFKLDGKELSLPPDAYIARASENSVEDDLASSFQAERVRLDIGRGDCELAVMGSSSTTNWGPLWILGMPFFRSYYATFHFGRSHDERALFVAPASGDCTPAGPEGGLARGAGYEQELRRVNHSAIFIPRIVHRARTEPFLRNL